MKNQNLEHETRKRLIALRAKGFKMSVISKESGVSDSMIYAYIIGYRNCSNKIRIKLEQALERLEL